MGTNAMKFPTTEVYVKSIYQKYSWKTVHKCNENRMYIMYKKNKTHTPHNYELPINQIFTNELKQKQKWI